MQPTILGVLVTLLGVVALFQREDFALKTALFLSLLGAGAVIKLPALGGASILAGSYFTGFLLLRTLITQGGGLRFLSAFRLTSPGFWLLLAIGYGIFAAYFIAPFFYGKIEVYPISRSGASDSAFALEQFRFTSGNLTQVVYAIGQVILYGSVTALIVTRYGHRSALNGLVALCVAHVAVSLLDVLTYYSGTGFLLDWLRTASYTSWTNNEIGGLKRISGLFPEASMYAIYGMTILGASLRLVLSEFRLSIMRPVFYMTLLLLLLSTSTTAYAALAIATCLLLVVSLTDAWLFARFRTLRILVGGALGACILGAAVVAIWPAVFDQLQLVFEETIANKLDSASGVDRSNLNSNAFRTFWDTNLLGAGIGSVRTSSFALTLVSNLGFAGTVFFVFFVASLFGRDTSLASCDPETDILIRAARWGVISGLIAASVSFHVFDLGPLFYILAALAHPRLLIVVQNRLAAKRRPKGHQFYHVPFRHRAQSATRRMPRIQM